MSDNIRSNISSNLLQIPFDNGYAPQSRRRLTDIIPIRRHSTGSRHSGTLPAPRRPTRKSTITSPVGLATVNLNTLGLKVFILLFTKFEVILSIS